MELAGNNSMTLIEAASVLRVHPATVRQRCLRGEIPHYRVLNKIFIRAADLGKFLQSQQSEPVRSNGQGRFIRSKTREL